MAYAWRPLLVIEKSIGHLFVMTGAVPNTTWLEGCVVLDAKGFIKTGFALCADELSAPKWPPARRPYLLETSVPGVFAAGDTPGLGGPVCQCTRPEGDEARTAQGAYLMALGVATNRVQ